MENKNFVLLALGANLGGREHNICRAIARIRERKLLSNIISSSLYETEPVGYTDQPDFLNMCIAGYTELEAEELLRACKKVEREIGRVKRAQWHEREIDIDLILYGEETIATEGFAIPHPRMHERRFVLAPAAEIAAEAVHPVLGRTVFELLRVCPDDSEVKFFSVMNCGNENP